MPKKMEKVKFNPKRKPSKVEKLLSMNMVKRDKKTSNTGKKTSKV
mgnify:CR=1 FL=1